MNTQSHRQRGQGLMEFAVIFPVFAFLLGAVIDGGLLMGRYNNVTHAATVGARFGAVSSGTDVGSVASATFSKTAQYAPKPKSPATYASSCDFGSSHPYAICIQWLQGPNREAAGDVGSSIRVKVKYHYVPLTPVVSSLGGFDVTACTVERQEQPIAISPGSMYASTDAGC